MARRKDWWRAQLFSYGPKYERGKVAGFHIVAKADDHTESGRFVDITMPDKAVENIRNAMTEYLARDRSLDAPKESEVEE